MKPVTAKEIAQIIAASAAASIRIALEQGCTADQVEAVAKAIGGNAGMTVYLELQDRGFVREG